MKPVYRFTVGGKIFVFGIWGPPKTVDWIKDVLEKYPFIRLPDGSNVASNKVTNIQVHDVACGVGFVFHPNGQMMRVY